MARGTAIGYFLGLVPGMSYILGSTAAYNFERWWHRQTQKKTNISVASVVASETASNTGSMTVLIPMILFGMPIIASEAIIYDLMVDAGAVFSLGSFLTDNYVTLAGWFVIACVLGVILSWPLANQFRRLSEILLDPRFLWILIALIIVSAGIEAYHSQKVLVYSVSFVLSLWAGWALRHRDVMPLVFVFVLGNNFQSIVYNLLQLYF
jgi:putative tricarboxylic transport membrane protein